MDLVPPDEWSDGERALVDALTQFWNVYHRVAAGIVLALPDHIVDELPRYVTQPQRIVATVAADGVVVAHVDHDVPAIQRGVTRQRLDDVVLEATGLFEPPVGPDVDMAIVQPAMQVTDVETGEVVGRADGPSRIEVVAGLSLERWAPRWGVAAARGHVYEDAYGLAAGRFVPFLSAASRALATAADDLATLLGTEPPEETLHQFVANAPQLLSATYLTVLSKPRLGAEHVPDFAYEDAPGRWTLVELERSTHPLFTKSGDPAAPLTHALRQVADWRAWVQEHMAYARTALRDVVQTSGLVVIGRSVPDRDRLHRLESSLSNIRIVTWDDVVASARRHAQNLHDHDIASRSG